ncbi:MAG: hypothetical protein GEV07_09150 [Streptosporangiales bacterium]|nr:hypothetical protein [Streptosporangiales bacterium]
MPHTRARVVVIATARPTFAVDEAAKRADQARTLLADLGADVHGPSDLVMTADDVEQAAGHLDGQTDLVVNVCASFSDASPALRLYVDTRAPVLLWAFREPGPVGDRLWLNSLCGANLFGHAVVQSGGSVRLLYGDPGEPAVEQVLRDALAGQLPTVPPLPTTRGVRAAERTAHQALDRLRGRRIGALGDAPAGFTPCDYDADLVRDLFGVEVERLDLDDAFTRTEAVDPDDRDAERSAACDARPSLRELDADEVTNAAAVTTALRTWTSDDRLDALAVRCWPEFPTELGVCPCSSLSRLADEGTVTACERDVYGALTMLLLEAAGAGTTYLVDTVDLDADRNVIRAWHCGSAATALAADPANATQYVHCNRRIGVAGNFPLRTGDVVLARLTDDPEHPGGLRLLLASGESVPEPNRFQGNTAAVRLDTEAEPFVHGLVTGGFPHHTVLAWTDVRPQLRTIADLRGIPVVEW